MADTCSTCGMPKNIQEFLASIIKVDTNGNYGINVHAISITDCNDLTDAVSCGQAYDFEELLLKTCHIDDCGNASINVFQDTQQ